MKHQNIKTPFYILILFLISACLEKKTELSQSEKNYLETQDSLIKYKSDIFQFLDEDSLQSSVSDYIKLDYQHYKTKYRLSEKEMDATRKAFITTYEIAKTFKEIGENTSRSDSNYSRGSIKGTYSFDQKLKPANVSKDEDTEVKVLMEDFKSK
ncbi:MAG: hypothetical protein K0S23_2516 [Fluviicola sp.]|jgi:hypothetical protein|uniref:hypothetical protein n=1 Tax=Fluviicola sp. TaxID=1917219 RepID=UPI002617DA93|nr:hypothetical protein [Fluviicola sp.]MDF3028209.1 hypothetical protein [Fluviicola sp.]